MNCADVRPRLSFFVEQECDPLETLQTRRHLDDCDRCRSRAAHLSSLARQLPELEQAAPKRDLAGSVMSRLRAMRDSALQGDPRFLSARWSGLAMILGAALAAITGSRSSVLRQMSRPFEALLGAFSGGSSLDGAGNLVSGAIALFLKASSGDVGRNLLAGAGPDLQIPLQILATALCVGMLLAVPVAALTAWLLYRSE